MIAEILLKVAGFEKAREMSYYPRPSMAGPERCLRQLCYMAQGLKGSAMDDRMVVVLDDSSWHEELTADWLRKTAFQLHSQQMAFDCGAVVHNGRPFVVKGHIDGILTDLSGIDRLWEHKALNHFTFQRYLGGQYPLDYLTQCALYLVGLQKIQPEISEAVLLIKNKNTSAYLEFLLSYDSTNDVMKVREIICSDGTRRGGDVFLNLYRDAFERFRRIERHGQERLLPERQYDLGDWHCEYCPYGALCWWNYEEEFGRLIQGAELEGDIAQVAAEYREVSCRVKGMERRQKELRDAMKKGLKTAGVSKGTAGGLFVSLTLQKRMAIDESLIPAEILQAAKKEKLMEVITIKKIRKKEEKSHERI